MGPRLPDVQQASLHWATDTLCQIAGTLCVNPEGIQPRTRNVELEVRRLEAAGVPKLAARVEHVSKTQGDGLGYDITSFETSGKERLIEVKTTRRGVDWPMFISRHEVEVSKELYDHYHLYRVFEFAKEKPGLYQLHGAIDEACDLDPQSYAGLPKAAA